MVLDFGEKRKANIILFKKQKGKAFQQIQVAMVN